jgi:hypothetical protein
MAWLELTPTDRDDRDTELFNMDRVRSVGECGSGTQLIFGIDPSNGEVDCTYVRESKDEIARKLSWPVIPQPQSSRT